MRMLAFIFVTLLSSLTWAADPYERTLYFQPGAKYVGEQLDLSATRNIIALSDPQIVDAGFAADINQIDRGFTYVANFRHQRTYWLAAIPKQGVKTAIFQYQNLSSLAKKGIPRWMLNWMRMGHVQMRFQMQDGSPIILKTQMTDKPSETLLVSDFSYALNAVRSVLHRKDGFSPLGDGLNDGYGLSHTFISTDDSGAFFKKVDLNVEQFPTELTGEEGDKLLATYMGISLAAIETDLYNTTASSCVTWTMKGLYTVVRNKAVIWWARVWRNWRWALEATNSSLEYNPRAVVALMVKQGYIDLKKRMPNLEVEYRTKAAASSCEALF